MPLDLKNELKNELPLEHRFEPTRCRHSINGITAVLHCHHFAALITQLAQDCGLLDGRKLLAECAEDAFYQVLNSIYQKGNITSLKDRIETAERYFAVAGLGKLTVRCAGFCSGEVILEHSHVDEGWLKKWGAAGEPVNHIGRGYITAMFSAVYGRGRREYRAVETESIVQGAAVSRIVVSDVLDCALHKE